MGQAKEPGKLESDYEFF